MEEKDDKKIDDRLLQAIKMWNEHREAHIDLANEINNGDQTTEQEQEHKVFYALAGRESIQEYTFRGNSASEWVAKKGFSNGVFKESEVINHVKKYENGKTK